MNKMKNLTWLMLIGLLVFTVSCDDNDGLLDDIIGDEDIELLVDDKVSKSVDVFVSDLDAGATSFTARVKFTSSDQSMRRLYITENYFGAGEEPYELKGVANLDTKGDGSIDLERDYKDEFDFEIPFEVYNTTTTGQVVYTLWATSGRGDFRDTDKRLTVGLGTITVDYGGNNPATDVKSYSTTILAAPLGSGTSETFISLLDGETYIINDGPEYAAFWDFGYYYGQTGLASLASVVDYPALFDHDNDEATALVDVIAFVQAKFPESDIVESELHSTFFSTSTMDFDAITKSSELSGIVASSSERINQLSVGDVVEFVDSYGKKGLIKVTAISEGYTGSITIDVKVQP